VLGEQLKGSERVVVDGRPIKLRPASTTHSYLAY
jgi:hypothetical protein